MTRRPPSILSVSSTSDGGIEVKWELDTFFADSAAPEKVLIDLNGVPFKELPGSEDSVEIPAAAITALQTAILAISVSFWWSGSPAEEQQSSVSVPVQSGGGAGGNSGVLPAAKPIVTVVRVQPRTVAAPNSIQIEWKSNNYNDGNIIWGPAAAPAAFRRNIRPVGEIYHGTFVTDRTLIPAAPYVFRVEVRNTHDSPAWIATTILVRSAADTLSLREFLFTSGKPATTSVATLVGPGKSLRKLLLG